jgi:dodecin
LPKACAAQDLQRIEKGMICAPGDRGVLGAAPPNVILGVRFMAKKKASSGIYRVTELIGTSTVSWEEAAKSAVETAAKTLRDLRVAEIVKLDMKVDDGKIVAYRARVALSFKYEA